MISHEVHVLSFENTILLQIILYSLLIICLWSSCCTCRC